MSEIEAQNITKITIFSVYSSWIPVYSSQNRLEFLDSGWNQWRNEKYCLHGFLTCETPCAPRILANFKYELTSYLFVQILELIHFFITSLLKGYDGCTISSPNLKIESKCFRRKMILAYYAVLSAYV